MVMCSVLYIQVHSPIPTTTSRFYLPVPWRPYDIPSFATEEIHPKRLSHNLHSHLQRVRLVSHPFLKQYESVRRSIFLHIPLPNQPVTATPSSSLKKFKQIFRFFCHRRDRITVVRRFFRPSSHKQRHL